VSAQTITVEVVYATVEQQSLCTVQLDPGATVADALTAAAAKEPFSTIALKDHAVGIFGRVCEHSQVLAEGDRVEIYRELVLDAKAARKRRERDQKSAASEI